MAGVKIDKNDYAMRRLCFESQAIDYYKSYLLTQLDSNPKNIFELMNATGTGWESTPACQALQILSDEGIAKESYRIGRYFQHRYFIKA